jgi:hypothetical protein
MTVPYIFQTATTALPLSQLDVNFATAITLGNTAVYLGNTTSTINNLTLGNVVITSGVINANVTTGNVNVTSGNISGVNITSITGNVTGAIPNSSITNVMLVNSNVTIGNTTVALGNTISAIGNITINSGTFTNASGNITSAIPNASILNNQLQNSNVTIGNTTVSLGGTSASVGNLTLNNATISSLFAPITVTQGGTGLNTLTANAVIVGNGTGNVGFVAPGTNGNYLTSNGTAWISATPGATTGNVTYGNTTVALGGTSASIGNVTLNNPTLNNVATLSIGTLAQSVAIGQGNASAMKNRIINGAMVIDQRNAGASVTPTTNGYSLDRWELYVNQSSKLSFQQNQGSVTPPVGFSNYLGLTSLSAYTVGSGDLFLLDQFIEGYNIADLNWGTANAKTVTLSFWVRSSLTGTFGGSFTNSGNARSYPFTYTISSANTWEQKSITVAGDTSGTWLTTNGNGLGVRFSIGCGSTYLGAAGSWASAAYFGATGQTNVVATNGATFQLTGVQLEVGSSATGFEYRQYTTDFQLCQRYYWRSISGVNFNTFAVGVVDSGTSCSGVYAKHPVTMRTTPTCSYSNIRIYDGSTAVAITSLAANWSSTESWSQGFNTTVGGLTVGRVAAVQSNGSSTSYIDASAEL